MSKTATLIRDKIGFQDQLTLNAGQKYCRMLIREHFAILLPFIKLPVVIKTIVLSTFEWPFYTDLTVHLFNERRTFNLPFGGQANNLCSLEVLHKLITYFRTVSNVIHQPLVKSRRVSTCTKKQPGRCTIKCQIT